MPWGWRIGAQGIAAIVGASIGLGPTFSAHADIYSATKEGKRLADAHCVSCHAIGTKDEQPRHDQTPTLRNLAPRLEAHPEKYRLFLTNPHHEMAAVSLDTAEIEALPAYIGSLRNVQ